MGSKAPEIEHHDILIIGAGLSGINTAHVVRARMPHRRIAILEKSAQLGGTWNLFKYPGFRSDSYMTSFGLGWYPWRKKDKMASADDIMEYLCEAAEEDGITPLIRFKHKVEGFEFDSEDRKWRLTVDADGTSKVFVANFMIGCTGYYSYDRAMDTVVPGIDDFQGQVVHPQWWPEDLDVTDKKVVLVGSGATAVTVVPELVKTAKSVVQLQRSPSYIMARHRQPPLDKFLHMLLPFSIACYVSHWLEIVLELIGSELLLKFPNLGRKVFADGYKKELPSHIDANVHFNPSYAPFRQRAGMCPEGDYFKALGEDNCEIVTDVIDTVSKTGIKLKSGRSLDADIIITATGLYFQLFDGIKPVVDGKEYDIGKHYVWRGCMTDSLPNAAFIFGYVTSSWTPGANVMAHLVVRLLKTMEDKGADLVVPEIAVGDIDETKLPVDASSNYLVKAADRMPKTTGKGPWYGRKNLWVDTWALWLGSMEEGLRYGGVKDKSV